MAAIVSSRSNYIFVNEYAWTTLFGYAWTAVQVVEQRETGITYLIMLNRNSMLARWTAGAAGSLK